MATNNPFNVPQFNRSWKGSCGHFDGIPAFYNIKYGLRAVLYRLMVVLRRSHKDTYHDVLKELSLYLGCDSSSLLTYVCEYLHVYPWDVLESPANYCGLLHSVWSFIDPEKAWPSLWIKDIFKDFPELTRNFYGS